MAHEVDRLEHFFGEILAALKPEGSLLLVEPKVHVPERRYAEIVAAAKSVGFTPHPTDPCPAQPGRLALSRDYFQISGIRGYWVWKPRMARAP